MHIQKDGNFSIHVIKHLIITCKNVRMFLLWAYKEGWGMTREIGRGENQVVPRLNKLAQMWELSESERIPTLPNGYSFGSWES